MAGTVAAARRALTELHDLILTVPALDRPDHFGPHHLGQPRRSTYLKAQ